jgi:hypothetical protein
MFLRATYFRWARRIEEVEKGAQHEPTVLSIGDCHLENFGTWRDGEARQVWGVNDFDDAAVMPYSLDLIRLATSARLAEDLDVPASAVCERLVVGYDKGLRQPSPVLLEQGDKWFRKLVQKLGDDVDEFWRDIEKAEPAVVPEEVSDLLEERLPAGSVITRISKWQRGGGSLGRPRFLALATWQHGRAVREAKALVPSAWLWAHASDDGRVRFLDLAKGQFRSPDPALVVKHRFIVRRLAPDSQKLSAKQLTESGRALELLEAMGREVGSIHACHKRAGMVLEHLNQRPAGWLEPISALAESLVKADYAEWCRDDIA